MFNDGFHNRPIIFLTPFLSSFFPFGNPLLRLVQDLSKAYKFLGQYSRAIEYFEQSLAIECEIRDRYIEAIVWSNLGEIFAKVERLSDALDAYHNARQLYVEMHLATEVKDCDHAIQQLSISVKQHCNHTKPAVVDD